MQERTTAPLCMGRSLQIVQTQHAGLCMPWLRARLAPQVICSALWGSISHATFFDCIVRLQAGGAGAWRAAARQHNNADSLKLVLFSDQSRRKQDSGRSLRCPRQCWRPLGARSSRHRRNSSRRWRGRAAVAAWLRRAAAARRRHRPGRHFLPLGARACGCQLYNRVLHAHLCLDFIATSCFFLDNLRYMALCPPLPLYHAPTNSPCSRPAAPVNPCTGNC